jgi:hypothetical protein
MFDRFLEARIDQSETGESHIGHGQRWRLNLERFDEL